jgi:hypothetical protein
MAQEYRLSTTLFQTKWSKPLPLSGASSTLNTPLVALCDNVYFFPLSWRKFILDTCRIQAPIHTNKHIQQLSADVSPKELLFSFGTQPNTQIYQASFDDVLSLLDPIMPSPLACSILSFLVRAETAYDVEEFQEQRTISFQKEFDAAVNALTINQVLDYRGIFGVNSSHLHPNLTGSLSDGLFRRYTHKLKQLKKLITILWSGCNLFTTTVRI